MLVEPSIINISSIKGSGEPFKNITNKEQLNCNGKKEVKEKGEKHGEKYGDWENKHIMKATESSRLKRNFV